MDDIGRKGKWKEGRYSRGKAKGEISDKKKKSINLDDKDLTKILTWPNTKDSF